MEHPAHENLLHVKEKDWSVILQNKRLSDSQLKEESFVLHHRRCQNPEALILHIWKVTIDFGWFGSYI